VGANVLEPPVGEPLAEPAPPARFPPAVFAVLEAPEAVKVMTLDPIGVEEDRPGLLHGFRVRGAAPVPTRARRQAVGRALIAANREDPRWSMCFDPHYAVRASRDGQAVDLLICFRCGNVLVVGPAGHAATYPFGWSAAGVIRRELRRGGVGRLWSWRRWWRS
jgi:hypothetical protein